MSILTDNELFIFDWDGTLSTSTFIVAASRLFARRYDPNYIKKHEQKYRKQLSKFEIRETKSRALANFYDAYVSVFPPKLKPGAIELLDHLKEKKKKIAIFSDSKSYRLISEIRMLGVTDYFDLVLSASSIGRYKPDPTGILAVLSKYKTEKSKTVYLGDAASDIIASRFAGVNSCGVGDGLESYTRLRAAEPDYLFKKLSDIIS